MSHSKKYIEILKSYKIWGISIIFFYICFAILNTLLGSKILPKVNENLVITDNQLVLVGLAGLFEGSYLIALLLIFWLLLELTSTDNIVSLAVEKLKLKKNNRNNTSFLEKDNFEPLFNIINSSLNDLDIGGARNGFNQINSIAKEDLIGTHIEKGENYKEFKAFKDNLNEYNENIFRSCIFSIGKGEQKFALDLIKTINKLPTIFFFKAIENYQELDEFIKMHADITLKNYEYAFKSEIQTNLKNYSKGKDLSNQPDDNDQKREVTQDLSNFGSWMIYFDKWNEQNLTNYSYREFITKYKSDISSINTNIKYLLPQEVKSFKINSDGKECSFKIKPEDRIKVLSKIYNSVFDIIDTSRMLKTVGENGINRHYQDISIESMNELFRSCLFFMQFKILVEETDWTEHHIWFIKDLAICALDNNQEYLAIEAIKKIGNISYNIIKDNNLSEGTQADIIIKSLGATKEIAFVAIDKKFERCTNTAIKSLSSIAIEFKKTILANMDYSELEIRHPEIRTIWHLKNVGKFAATNRLEKSIVRTCQMIYKIFNEITDDGKLSITNCTNHKDPLYKFIQRIIEANSELGKISRDLHFCEALSILIICDFEILKYLYKCGKSKYPYAKMLCKSLNSNIKFTYLNKQDFKNITGYTDEKICDESEHNIVINIINSLEFYS